MRILLLVSSFNSLTQLILVELEARGYELEDGFRICHTGDTGAFGDMKLIGERVIVALPGQALAF